MSKRVRKKNSNIDLNSKELKPISSLLSEMMKDISHEDDMVDTSSLDQRFLQKLSADEQNKKLHDSISKKLMRNGKNKAGSSFLSSWNPAWNNLAILGALMVVLITAGASTYFWPSEDGEPAQFAQEADTTLAQEAVYMKPQNITESGYVASDSSFLFEIAGELDVPPEDLVTIQPAVNMEYSLQEEEGKIFLTADPVQDLMKDTEYTITLASNTSEPKEWSLMVEPTLAVASSHPKYGSRRVDPESAISIVFNHKNVTLERFLENITIEPAVEGTWSQNGSEMIFLPKTQLEPETEYLFTLSNEMSNQLGEKMSDLYELSFKTSLKYPEKSDHVRWSDHHGREILNMSQNIVTKAVSSTGGELEYQLYEIDGEVVEQIIRDYLENGEIKITEQASLVDTQTLSSDTYYQYEPTEKGKSYLLKASDQYGSALRLINMSELAPIAVESRGSIEGWVIPLVEGISKSDIKAYGVRAAQKSDVVLDQDLFFTAQNVDYLMFTNGNGVAVWLSDWELDHDTGADSQEILLDQVMIHTSSPVYKKGDLLDYYVYFGDHLNRNTLYTDYSDLVVSIQKANLGYDQGLTSEIEMQKLTVDPSDLTASGTFNIPNDYLGGFIRISLMNGKNELGSKLVKISEDHENDVNAKLMLPKARMSFGESAQLKISGDPNSEYILRIFTGTVEATSVLSDLSSKAEYGSGNIELYTRSVKSDELGNASWNFTPYDISISSPYQVYTVSVESPDYPYTPLDSKDILVSTPEAVLTSKVMDTGYLSDQDPVSVTLSTYDPLSGVGVAGQSFKVEQVLVRYALSQDGKVIQSQISTVGESSGITDQNGRFELSIQKPEAGTYYLYRTDLGRRYYVGSFDVYSPDILQALSSSSTLPVSLSHRSLEKGAKLQLFIPSLDSNENAKLFTFRNGGEELSKLQPSNMANTNGLLEMQIESVGQGENSVCYYYPVNSQLKGGCEVLYIR